MPFANSFQLHPNDHDMSEITQILDRMKSGDEDAQSQLFSKVYEELKAIASSRLRSTVPQGAIRPTELVHETYLRITNSLGGEMSWENRAHFFGAAAEAMRRIIVDHIRFSTRQKRGGDMIRLPLLDVNLQYSEPSQQVLDINDALGELEEHDPMVATIVKLRFFMGMKHQEAASAIQGEQRLISGVYGNPVQQLARCCVPDE